MGDAIGGIGDGTETDFRRLTLEIEHLEGRRRLTGNRLYYLGVPPQGIGLTGIEETLENCLQAYA